MILGGGLRLGLGLGVGRGSADTSILTGMRTHSWWISSALNGDNQTIDNQGTSAAGVATLGSTSGVDATDPYFAPWYDPTDIDVTVDGVGYRYLSENLVTNGTFDTDTGWTAGADWSISGGIGTKVTGASTAYLTRSISVNAGTAYLITVDVLTSNSTGVLRVDFTGGTTVSGPSIGTSGTGTFSFILFAKSGNNVIAIVAQNIFAGSIDNVVVREVAVGAKPNYVYLDGANGTYISQADEAGNSQTGAFTMDIDCAADDWINGASQSLITKGFSTGQKSVWWSIGSAGNINVTLSADGTTTQFKGAPVNTFVDGERVRLRMDYDGVDTARIFESADGVSYTQYGTDLTFTTVTGSLHDSTDPVAIGSFTTSSPFKGRMYEAKIYSGIDESKVLVSHWKASAMGDSGGPDSNKGNYDVEVSGVKYSYKTADLLTNGTFDADLSGWDDDSGAWVWSGGTATNVNSGATDYLDQSNLGFSNTAIAYVTFTIVSCSDYARSGTRIGTASNISFTSLGISAPGNYALIYDQRTNGVFRFYTLTGGSAALTVDNITCREVGIVSQGNWTLNGNYSVAVPSGDYVYLPGTSGNYVSTASKPAGITGATELTIISHVKIADNGGTYQMAVESYDGVTSGFSWQPMGATTRQPRLYLSGSATSCSATFDPSTTEWFRVSWKDSTNLVRFYTSTDGVTWTQLGTDGSNPGSVAESGVGILVGRADSGDVARMLPGEHYKHQIYNTFEPTGDPVWEFDASLSTQGGYTDAYSGEANTINRSATGLKSALITRPTLLFNSAASTYAFVADHADLSISETDSFTLWFYGRYHGTSIPSNGIMVSKKNSSGSFDGYELRFSGTTETAQAVFDSDVTINIIADSVLTAGSAKLVADIRDAGNTIGIYDGTIKTGADTTTTAPSESNALVVAARPDGTLPNDLEVWAWGVIKGKALSAAQLTKLKTELDSLLGGRTGE